MLETVVDDLTQGSQQACPVCGGSSFFEEGGYYYCSLCNTQSQVSQLYVDEEFREEIATRRVRTTRLRDKKKKTTVEETRRQLSLWEIWNIVLKNMADRLIEIGFSEDIKTKIFHIYISFLKKRRVIFVSTLNANAKSSVTLKEPKLNLYALYGIKKKKSKKNVANTRRIVLRKKKQQGATLDVDDTLRLSSLKSRATRNKRKAFEKDYTAKDLTTPDVDEHEFDNIIDEASSQKPIENANKIRKPTSVYTTYAKAVLRLTRSRMSKAKPFLVNKVARKNYEKCSKTTNLANMVRFERFTFNTCLITVFVALRELGYPVVMTDILRLHSCGILNVENVPDYISQVEEYQNIAQTLPKILFIRQYTNYHNYSKDIENFVNYLELEKFSHPSMKEVVPKYIDEFVLPREFECLVNLINHMFAFNDYSDDLAKGLNLEHCQMMPEILVLAQFVVVLKMLFGLDDRTEKFQSKFAQLVNRVVKEETQKRKWEMEEWTELFVIEEWFGYLQRRRELVKRELCSSLMYTPNRPPSIAKLQDLMKDCLIDDASEESGQHEAGMKPHEKAAKSCKLIFQNIVKETLAEENQEIPNLKPYIPLPLPSESVVKQYIERYPSVADQSVKPELLMAEFVKKRLDFIWNPKKYKKLLKLHGYRVKIIRGDAINNFPNELSQEIEESKVILVFQPYKNFDEFVGRTRDDCSSSIKLILGLCEDILPAVNLKWSQRSCSEPFFQKLVNAVGDMYIKRVLAELVPIMTRWNQPDSE